VFSYGPGDPVLRFVSHGVLVIDSADRLTAPRPTRYRKITNPA